MRLPMGDGTLIIVILLIFIISLDILNMRKI